MKKILLLFLFPVFFISCNANKRDLSLTYNDCGLKMNGETFLLISGIENYKNLNLENAEVLYSYEYLHIQTIVKQKDFNGIKIKWFEDDGVPQNIILLETTSEKIKTPRGIHPGSSLKQLYKKYGEKEINKNGEIAYWHGSLEFETQIGIIFSIENNKVSKIHIESYD